MIQRRGFLLGAAGCIIGAHAPAIVRAASLMPIRSLVRPIETVSGMKLLMLYPLEIGRIEGFRFYRDGQLVHEQWR